MVIQFPGNSGNFTSALRETSKKLPVSDEQYDRILQSVLCAVGKPDAVHYAKAAQTIDRMVSSNVTKVVNHVIATGTGAAVMAAALFLVVSVNTEPRGGSYNITIDDQEVPLSNWGEMEIPGYSVEALSPYDTANAGAPILESFMVEDGFIKIYFSNISDDDLWTSIFGVDSSGKQYLPVEVSEEEGMVKFALPEDRLEIYFQDVDGNLAQMKLGTSSDTE